MTTIVREASGAGVHPISARPPLTSMSDEQAARAIQILTTEHFTLQGARANTVSETNGRIAIFLGMVSSTLIALAFVGKISGRAPPGSQRRSLLRVAPRPRVHRAGPSQYPVSGADLLGTVEPLE